MPEFIIGDIFDKDPINLKDSHPPLLLGPLGKASRLINLNDLRIKFIF